MKKIIPFLLFILFDSFCYAQDWNCFVPGTKQYFTNSNGYLRGMRIDSVRAVGGNMVYYPFHTARGKNSMYVTFDSTGSSWLGKNVIRQSDGSFIFNNLFDTVFINTLAGAGDSWIFYNDTSQYYYKATVISIDTMSFAGVLDSVKRIVLTAYDSAGVFASDSMNGFEIILSKSHGFAKVFDLYTFPYHLPDSENNYGSVNGIDYYLTKSMSIGAFGGGWPGKLNEQFSQTNLINPTFQQLYNWKVGDVFEYSICYDGVGCISTYGPTEYKLDTVENLISLGAKTMYVCKGWVSHFTVDSTGMHVFYKTTYKNDTFSFDNSLVIDTSLMPEEYLQPNIYYFVSADSTFCRIGAEYIVYNNLLHGIGPPWYFEPIYNYSKYKPGIGLADHEHYEFGSVNLGNYTLIYYENNDTVCGSYVAASVPEVGNGQRTVTIYPNPANDGVTIKLGDNNIDYRIELINVFGQVVISTNATGKECRFSVNDLPSGLYEVRVSDGSEAYNQKLIVEH
jgi:hypothetical protein